MSDTEKMQDQMQGTQNAEKERNEETKAAENRIDQEKKSEPEEPGSRNDQEAKSDDKESGSRNPQEENEENSSESRNAEKESNEETKAAENSTMNKKKTDESQSEIIHKRETHSRSISQQCEQDKCIHQHSLKQQEKWYTKKLQEKNSALEKKKKELESFKDRMALHVAVSIKTGDTESMNDPVSKTRLTEMYDSLKLEKWTEIKDLLKSNKTSPEFTRALVQKTFKDAAEEMQKKKQQIEEAFRSTESSGGQENQKVDRYRKLAAQNLQLALYHSNKDLLKSPFPEYEGEKAEDVMVNLRRLTSECYWLGCLIALNNPPLQPDWETQHYVKNSWDIFPQRLKDSEK